MEARYTIGKQIGAGGAGLVYHGFDTFLKRDVAIKRILDPKNATEEEVKTAARNLIAEAQTLSTLNHPNIVTVFDVGIDDQGGYVVMELLEGETLYHTVARGVLTEEDFVAMAVQTMEALIAAHSINLLHRDIKSTNIMVIWQPSGRFHAKILDYGLSKFSPKPSIQTSDQDGTILGSILFMSPEQFERGELDARTDLYSMGCVYYYSLTGSYPYDGDNHQDIMTSHLEHRVTPLEELRPDLSPSVCQWVMWLINRNMENRPKNAQEALAILPMQPDQAIEQSLQEVPVEKTGKVKRIAIPTSPPVQGANVPTGFVVVRGGLDQASGKKGSTTTLLVGKPGVKPKPRSIPKSDQMGRKLVMVVIGLAAIIAIYMIATSAIAYKKEMALNVMGGQTRLVLDAKSVDLLLSFIYSEKSTLQEKATARDALTRMEGESLNGLLLGRIRDEAPTSDARITLCRVMGDRKKTDALPDILEAVKSATSQSEIRSILNVARQLVASEMTPIIDEKELTPEESDRNAVLNIYLDKIGTLQRSM